MILLFGVVPIVFAILLTAIFAIVGIIGSLAKPSKGEAPRHLEGALYSSAREGKSNGEVGVCDGGKLQ